MVSHRLRKYLHNLDKIEARARRNFGGCTSLYLHFVTTEFMRYWRCLQDNCSAEIQGKMWDELYFFFNEKLYEVTRCRIDMMWMIYEFDGADLFHEGHNPSPFWR